MKKMTKFALTGLAAGIAFAAFTTRTVDNDHHLAGKP